MIEHLMGPFVVFKIDLSAAISLVTFSMQVRVDAWQQLSKRGWFMPICFKVKLLQMNPLTCAFAEMMYDKNSKKRQ